MAKAKRKRKMLIRDEHHQSMKNTAMSFKQIDKQIADLSKSVTVIRRKLDTLYRRYDNDLGDVAVLEHEIWLYERRVHKIVDLGMRLGDYGSDFS